MRAGYAGSAAQGGGTPDQSGSPVLTLCAIVVAIGFAALALHLAREA
jgi:hypothetical protein